MHLKRYNQFIEKATQDAEYGVFHAVAYLAGTRTAMDLSVQRSQYLSPPFDITHMSSTSIHKHSHATLLSDSEDEVIGSNEASSSDLNVTHSYKRRRILY